MPMSSPRKKNIIFIGVITFMSISVVGIILDVILQKKGRLAIPAVAAAFFVLAIFFLIEWIMRKRSERELDTEDDQFYAQDDMPNEQRFLRHAQPVEDEYDDDEWEDASLDDFGDDEEDFVPAAPAAPRGRFGGVFRKRDQNENEISSVISDERAQDDAFFEQEDDVTDFEDDNDAFEDNFDDEPQEDFLKPVMVIGAPEEQRETLIEDIEPEEVQPEAEEPAEPEQEEEDIPAEDEAEEISDDIPDEDGFTPVPLPRSAETAVAAVSTTGQTLESFYENMSDEDILYRDCVEVWAADTKPYILRMIKYIEGIEDKQTQALFGKECEFINAMLDRIYAFTQLEYIDDMLEPKQYVFSTLVKECLKRFSPFFMEKKIGLLWKGLDINVVVDKRWFIFALTQILFNAVEFTDEGGKIAISAKRTGDFIDLIVDDSGKGISPEEMPYIFVAGYMGDESPNEDGRRTGMGLFIARSVIVKMGGDVYAESSPGKGTRITIHLPAGCEEEE